MSAEDKPTDQAVRREFREWAVRFDAALNDPGPRKAWTTLIDHNCDSRKLTAALFYAAFHAGYAQDTPQEVAGLATFSELREAALKEVAELKQTLQRLKACTARGASITNDLFVLWRIGRKDRNLFEGFFNQLERFEGILKTLQVPGHMRRSDIEQDADVARGEALLHVYVEETTKRLFYEETAVLLEASAECYGLKHRRKYSMEAVKRRYQRWFRNRTDSNYAEMCSIVRGLQNGDTFLQDFLHLSSMIQSFQLGLFQNVMSLMNSLDTGDQSPSARQQISVPDPFELLRKNLGKRASARKRSSNRSYAEMERNV